MAWLAAPLLGTLSWLAAANAVAAAESIPEPSLPGLLGDWSFDPSIQLPLLLTAAAYLYAVRRVNRQHPGNPVPTPRTIAFLAGLAFIEVALQGPINAYDDILFADHMIQHILLMMAAAPLLVLGAPITLALRVASPRVRTRWLLPVLHSRPVEWLSNPLVAWLLFAGALWGTHFSGIYELALENDTVHYLEHVLYLAVALLFWWPMLGRDPSRWRLPYPVRLVLMFLQMVQGSFLGVAILNSETPLYRHYVDLHLAWISPLADQQTAGATMWVFGSLGFLVFTLVVIRDWIAAERAEAARVDARLDRQERERRAAATRFEAYPDAPTSDAGVQSFHAATQLPMPRDGAGRDPGDTWGRTR